MKYIKIIVVIFLLCLVTACSSNIQKSGVVLCERSGEISNSDATTKLNYEVYYTGIYVTKIHSIEKIYSTDKNLLDTYQNAYESIFKAYENLEHYDNIITRDDISVTSDTTINYKNIDIKGLLEIEGEEDNVIEDGKVKLNTWINFAKKYGATCNN